MRTYIVAYLSNGALLTIRVVALTCHDAMSAARLKLGRSLIVKAVYFN
jgi:hypothetical protein